MTRKLGVGLVPLLAIVTFAIMPAAAQAAPTPHWYSNNILVPEGVPVTFTAWGKLALTTSNGGAPNECENIAAGYVENPVGGGAGKTEIHAWQAYDCTNTECEAGGGKTGRLFENEGHPGANVRLEWPGQLTEAVAGTIRLVNSNIRELARCQYAASTPSNTPVTEGPLAGTEERTTIENNGPGATLCTSGGGGASSPKIEQGTSVGKPSKITFTGGAGGELECGEAGKGIITGKLKMMGYTESEVLAPKKN